MRVIPRAQQQKTYGQADPNFLFSVFTTRSNELLPGLKNSDTIANTFTGLLSRDAGNDVASYWIRQGTLSAGPNYTIEFQPERFSINAARLSISAPTLTSVAGFALPAINLSYTGFVAPRPGLAVDTVASAFSVLPQATTTARSTAPGNYRIDINPGVARNYIISTSPGLMLVLPPPPPPASCCIPRVTYTPGIQPRR
ncbi:MAG: MBG domain-containing protein [Sandarakinorhabdus sp.]